MTPEQKRALDALDQAVQHFDFALQDLVSADQALSRAMADCRAANVVTPARARYNPPKRRLRRATKPDEAAAA